MSNLCERKSRVVSDMSVSTSRRQVLFIKQKQKREKRVFSLFLTEKKTGSRQIQNCIVIFKISLAFWFNLSSLES